MQLKWRLSHARGYIELGMWVEAAAELQRVAPADQNTPEFLRLKGAILQSQQDWPALRRVSEQLVRVQPDEADGWIMWAYATRRADSLAAADAILRQAEKIHPNEPTIQFNIGCYACQLGNLIAAKARVEKAIALDPRFREAAATDPDLKPLRDAG